MKNIYSEILELAEGGHSGILVTVVEKQGSGPAATGTKMIVYPDGKTSGTVGGGSIEKMAIKKALKLLESNENVTEHYIMDEPGDGTTTGMICGGSATLFFEYFAPKKHVYIFGAGHIGKALCYHLKPLNYQITVIDDREEVLREIHDADEKIHASFADALNNRSIGKDAFFVIATYQHTYDSVVLNKIYHSKWEPKYVGMVASRKKQKQLIAKLKKEVPNADTSNCYVPAGLNIGGTLPHEIALSIISEMQTVANDKNVKHLRDGND
ncbi:MAG: XdhC/CoxI family protein [Candidatus Marinimicrobia bacterium]|nr:XdhC/CoxI family protein [Candidatus Neomarinimicrobiota bacterium]